MTIYDDFDELASAYLDGETTAEEAARVEADPEIMARVEEFRLLSGAIAQPVELPDEATRQAAIAAAIGAATPTAAPAPPPQATTSEVSSLAAARARRQQRNSRILSVAAGFAAVVVGGVLIWAIATNSGTGSQTASEVTDTATDAVESVSDAASESVQAATDAAGDAADDAMEDDAMEEEEAMEEEATEDDTFNTDAMEEAFADAAPAAELRQGDDDDALDEAAEEAVEEQADETNPADQADDPTSPTEPTDGGDDADSGANGDATAGETATATLPELLSSLSGESTEGLFVVGLPARNDFLGTFGSIDELLADPRMLQATGDIDGFRSLVEPELAPLEGAECPAIAARLALAESLALVATAQVLEPVSGTNSDLAIVQATTDGTTVLLGIDLIQCRVLIGEDDLP